MTDRHPDDGTLGKKTLEFLSSFFSKAPQPTRTDAEPHAAAPSSESATDTTPRASTHRMASESFHHDLGALLGNRGDLAAANLQVLGLSALKKKIAGKWYKHKDTIETAIERTLSKSLTANDRYWQLDDELYIIAFEDTDLDATTRRTAEIGEAIVKRLVGTEAGTLTTVRAFAGMLARNEDGNVQFSQASTSQRTGTKNGETRHTARGRATETTSTVTFTPWAKTIRSDEGTEDLERLLTEAAEAHKQRLGLHIADNMASQTENADWAIRPPLDYSFGFSPVWDAKRKAITAYAVLPHYQENAVWKFEHEVLGDIPSVEDVLDLDVACLRMAIRETAKSFTTGNAVLIISQIHYRTLTSKSALAEVLQECARVPDFLRKYLTLQVVGMPLEIPKGLVAESLVKLHRHFQLISVRVGMSANLADMKQAGFNIVSHMHDAPDLSPTGTSKYQKFIATARLHSLPVVAEYLTSPDVAAQFVGIGIHYLSGIAIGTPLNEPGGVVWCELETLPIEADNVN